MLLVKQKLGAGEYWCMPMGVHAEGETMRKVQMHSIYVHPVILMILPYDSHFVEKFR